MSSPLVSIIIPVYNGEEFLAEAIESPLAQSYSSIEIIVVDDGSTDKTREIASNYDEVIYQYQENSGVAAARNAGIDLSHGELIAFLDADDLWLKNKLDRQVEFLQNDSSHIGCLVRFKNFLQPGTSRPPWVLEDSLSEQGSLAHSPCTLLAKREVFETVGKFATDYKVGSDAEWFFRAKDLKADLAVIDEIHVHRRIHDRNLGHDQSENRKVKMRILKESIVRQGKLKSQG